MKAISPLRGSRKEAAYLPLGVSGLTPRANQYHPFGTQTNLPTRRTHKIHRYTLNMCTSALVIPTDIQPPGEKNACRGEKIARLLFENRVSGLGRVSEFRFQSRFATVKRAWNPFSFLVFARFSIVGFL